MRISQMIAELEALKRQHGDIEFGVQICDPDYDMRYGSVSISGYTGILDESDCADDFLRYNVRNGDTKLAYVGVRIPGKIRR